MKSTTPAPYVKLAPLKEMNSGEHIYVEIKAQTVAKYAQNWRIKISVQTILLLEDLGEDPPTIKKIVKVTKL